MTRLAVIADIHGNLPALEAVVAHMAQFQPDQVIVAGDVVNPGAFSRETFAYIQRQGWPVIRGNHEMYALEHDTPRAHAVWQQKPYIFSFLDRLQAQLGPQVLAALATWPDSLSLRFPDGPSLLITHGSPRNHWDIILEDTPLEQIEPMFAGVMETTVVIAHTHEPLDRIAGPWHIINPGSVGAPLDGIHMSSYAILEAQPDGWTVQHHRVPLDDEPVLQSWQQTRFVEECGAWARMVIEEYRQSRRFVRDFFNWYEAYHLGEPSTPELAEYYIANVLGTNANPTESTSQ